MQQHGSARVTRVSESDAIAVAGVLYQPIRRTLGVRAFGINAYFAPRAGDQLIEKHDETGSGAGRHAELYVVLSGHASFRVDSEEIDAPVGTIVFVPDPSSQREATAIEDGTSAIVVGGPADRELPISPFEFWFVAAQPYNAGDYTKAIEIVTAGLEEWPDHPAMLYQLACYYALAGDREQALDHFERACAGSPKVKTWQADDSDLDAIRNDPRFTAALTS
jgi:tetratricopeptide (TPR) repeat protein